MPKKKSFGGVEKLTVASAAALLSSQHRCCLREGQCAIWFYSSVTEIVEKKYKIVFSLLASWVSVYNTPPHPVILPSWIQCFSSLLEYLPKGEIGREKTDSYFSQGHCQEVKCRHTRSGLKFRSLTSDSVMITSG